MQNTLPDDEPLPHVLELMKTDSKSERGGGGSLFCTVQNTEEIIVKQV